MAPKSINDLQQDEVAEIAKVVGVEKVTGIVGTTPGSMETLALFLIILWVFFYRMTYAFFDPLTMVVTYIGLVLTLAGLDGLKLFFVSTPKYTRAITRNWFTGSIYVKREGLEGKYLWELYEINDFINMRRDVLEKTSTFQTKDGVRVSYRWTLQYHPVERLLGLYVSTEHEDFVTGLIDIVENKLKSIIALYDIDEIRLKSKDKDSDERINNELRSRLKEDRFEGKEVTIEERFGIYIENATIGPPLFATEFQEALETSVIRAIVQNDTLKLAEALGIPKGEALNMIAIFNKEKVEKKINEVSLSEMVRKTLLETGLNVENFLKAVEKLKGAKPTSGDAPTTNPPPTE